MSDPKPHHRTIETQALWEQLVDLEDGSLHPDEREELMTLLDESEAARRLYAEYFMHSEGLAAEARFLDEQGRLPVLSDPARSSRLFVRSLLVAAAVLVVGAIVASFVMLQIPDAPLLSAESTANAKWTIDGLTQDPENDELTVAAGSTVQVTSGTLKLHLESGATMILQGPAQVSFPELEKPILHHGWLWVDTDSSSEPFEVKTPHLLIRDIGTRFGIRVPEQGPAEVHLIEGKVEVFDKKTQEMISVIEPKDHGLLVPVLGEPMGITLARDPFPGLADLLAKNSTYATTIQSQNPAGFWQLEDPETQNLLNEIQTGVTGGRHQQTKITKNGLSSQTGFRGFDPNNHSVFLSGGPGQNPISLGVTPVHQGFLFRDDFDGNDSDIDASSPDETLKNAKWISSPRFKRNGRVLPGPGSATLGFTPLDGCLYTADASLRDISGEDDSWIAFGFANGQSNGTTHKNRFVDGSPEGRIWMFARGNNDKNPNMAHTRGTGDPAEWNGPLANANGGDLDLRIVLDTTKGAGNWRTTWYAKRPDQKEFTCIRPSSPLVSEMIGSIGFASSGGEITGTLKSFSLRAKHTPDRTTGQHFADGPAQLARREGAVSFWVRREQEARKRETLWAAGDDPSDNAMSASMEADGRVAFFMENGRYDVLMTSRTKIDDGRWHHLVFSWSPSSVDIYLDGKRVARDNDGRSMQQGILTEFRFGNGPNGTKTSSFSGWLDAIAVWDRPLKAVEVHHQFQSAKGE